MIELINISKCYADKPVLKELSAHIELGDRVLIKGPSGIGKSTIFNLIMGFELPDSGIMNYYGKLYEQYNITNIRSNIAWLPQNLNIIGNGNVGQYFHKLNKYSANTMLNFSIELIFENFKQLNLNDDTIDKEFQNLSGGELQRVGLVICKLLARDLLLLDEPTSALDPESTIKAIEYIVNMNKTIICISHNSDLDPYFTKQIVLG